MNITALLTWPHLVDVVLVFTAIEALCLSAFGRWRPAVVSATIRLLLPGVFLMLALRAALAGAAWPWVPLALMAALFAHIVDLTSRWRR